jgi:hypothetical protein
MGNKYAKFSKVDQAQQDLRERIHRRGFLMCSKKRKFNTERGARMFLESTGYPGRPYRCDECLLWHNTTQGVKRDDV